MKFIVKLFPEIMMKSKSVRKRFIKILEGNLRNVLRRVDETCSVKHHWDRIEVVSRDPSKREALIEATQSTPGVAHFLEVEAHQFKDLHHIYELTLEMMRDQLEGKRFCVRSKRTGQHDFTSIELERYVGGGLNQNIETASVDLRNPELTVRVDVINDEVFLVKHRHEGLGGFPIATQEDVLSLISGGFDSGVASYEMIRRGSRTHYCFFNLGGKEHETGVKQVAYYLWDKFSASHRVKFVAVDFEPVVAEILDKIDDGLMGVVLKRMMMRAASLVAERMGVNALVTGEAIGQVSSQTITNLNVIDRVTDTLILRPLIAADKPDIIQTSREIGTEDFAKVMPEFCGVISRKPTVKADLKKVEVVEANFDMDLLEKVVLSADVLDIRKIAEDTEAEVTEVEMVSEFQADEIVLDIRSAEEEEEKPLELEGVAVAHMPFFKLSTQFDTLDQSKTYLLYCDRGVMSRLQALYLKDAGFKNIKVYRP